MGGLGRGPLEKLTSTARRAEKRTSKARPPTTPVQVETPEAPP
jgi:hypothetical protein